MPERLFSTYQVADLLGATHAEVAQWVRDGWLTVRRDGDGAVRVSESGLIQFLRRQGIDIGQVMDRVARMESQEPLEGELCEEPAAGAPAPEAAPGPVQEIEPGRTGSAPAPVVEPAPAGVDSSEQVLDAVLDDAVARRATHVHLEPSPEGLRLRLRVDGVLREKVNFPRRLPSDLAAGLAVVLKRRAGLDPAPARRAQQGTFRAILQARQVELRVSVVPTVLGDRFVLRVIDPERVPAGLDALGLSAEDAAAIRRLLSRGYGLVLVVAPPRAELAETLQALAATLARGERSVVCVARRVEAPIEGASLSQVDPEAGFTFAEAVRGLTDQDADAIVVGDLGSPAAALAALDAAAEGALVVGGIRADSAPGAAAILVEMVGDPWAASTGLIGVVERRAVRRLCDACKVPVEPADDLLALAGVAREDLPAAVFAPAGCAECLKTGYVGPMSLLSILTVDQAVATALRRGAARGDIERAASASGWRSLRDAALAAMKEGRTSLEEIARVPEVAFGLPGGEA